LAVNDENLLLASFRPSLHAFAQLIGIASLLASQRKSLLDGQPGGARVPHFYDATISLGIALNLFVHASAYPE
jgi:hypothetical protein